MCIRDRGKKAGQPLAELQKTLTMASIRTLQKDGYGTYVADNLKNLTVYLGQKTAVEDRLAANIEAIYKNPVSYTHLTIGNYDYIMDWRFDPDGGIEVAVGATGIIETKHSLQEKAPDHADHAGPEYGQFVAAHTIGVNLSLIHI